jgi:hypothetical protein
MKVLQTIWSELIGLFVDDWRFAALVIAWIAVFKIAFPHPTSDVLSLVFFLGLAGFAVWFVALKARASRTASK